VGGKGGIDSTNERIGIENGRIRKKGKADEEEEEYKERKRRRRRRRGIGD